ncbi:MAG: hypothetical protein OEY86_20965, partial [Nitrospira sp.]|nr:hypothetical protein [Nitrospira sp.]
MTATAAKNPTLLDITKLLDPDGSVAAVAEILDESNPILQDITMVEGNLPTGHVSTIRTGIPTPTWFQFYGGIQPTKGTTAQVTDQIGMMGAYAEIDYNIAKLNGNSAAYRLSEDRVHIEGMAQSMAETLFQGNPLVDPTKFLGLNARYNDLSAESADNIIDAEGTGVDNASIWLIGWSPSTIFGIYPKGSEAGLEVTDKGQVTDTDIDGAGGRGEIYRTHFQWKKGLVVKDWRYAVRIPNIDRSLLTADVSTGANLPNLMFEALDTVPNLANARFAFYMDKSVLTKLRQQSEAAIKQSSLTVDQVGGIPVTSFHGVPIRRTDALAVDE